MYIAIIFLIFFIVWTVIRLKYGFWYHQPVFHVFNLLAIFKSPYIVQPQLVKPTRYYQEKNIVCKEFTNLSATEITRFSNLIRTQYLANKDNTFRPDFKKNVLPYFVGHMNKSFISLYLSPCPLIDYSRRTLVDDWELKGAITSRPLQVRNTKHNTAFSAYYIDYLCVAKKYRKQGIAPELIQTHEYQQRLLTNNFASVSIFKREEDLTGIVPMCVYTTYGYNMFNKMNESNQQAVSYKNIRMPDLNPYEILTIDDKNFSLIHSFLMLDHNFSLTIVPDIGNLLQLVETGNIQIKCLREKNTLDVAACYFFRETCINISAGKPVVSCFASICCVEPDVFFQGFTRILHGKKEKIYLAIEDISHNHFLIDRMDLAPEIQSPTAYYFYNYICPTFDACSVIFIS